MLKLNTLSNSIFEVNSENDSRVRVNTESGETTISRNDIIATGRAILAEKMGRNLSFAGEKYESRLNSKGIEYRDAMEIHRNNLLLFCAARANAEIGKEAPKSVQEIKNNALFYSKNDTFFKTLMAITTDVITPLFADTYSDIGARGLVNFVEVPLGGTFQLDIKSNDTFIFEDSSWGASRSTSKNYLYGKTITFNPKPYSCNATIKFYQDLVTGDVGDYYASIMRGTWNKIYALAIGSFTTGAADTRNVPSALIAPSYTSENFIRIKELVAAANGVATSDLIAVGSAVPLSKILPVDGTGAAMLGLQYGLGERWFEQGFLPKAAEVSLMKIPPVIVAGTQNTTVQTIDLGDDIYIIARAGNGYAPVYAAMASDSPITLVRDPADTADFTIDINVTLVADVKAVFASKVGIIQG